MKQDGCAFKTKDNRFTLNCGTVSLNDKWNNQLKEKFFEHTDNIISL